MNVFILLDIIDLNHEMTIKLDFKKDFSHIDFNTKGELILHNETTIWIHSIVGGERVDKKICRTPKDYKLIRISKSGQAYLLSGNYIYESSRWNDVEIIV